MMNSAKMTTGVHKLLAAEVPSRSDTNENKALLVLGMHRSGTSSVTRVLSLLGMDLPATLIGPSEYNSSGYWESPIIRDLNEELLTTVPSNWFDCTSVPNDWFFAPKTLEAHRKALQTLLSEFGDSKCMVLKDPRICRLAPFWLDVLKMNKIEPSALLVVRNPLEVSNSLEKRNGFTPAFSRMLWLRHVLDAERYTRKISRGIVVYEDVLENWRASFQRATNALNMEWPEANRENEQKIDDFLDPTLRHHVSGNAQVRTSAPEPDWFDTVYEVMLRWSRHGEQQQDFNELDRVRAEFDRAALIFFEVMQTGQIAIAEAKKKEERFNKQRLVSENRLKRLEKKCSVLEQSERKAKEKTARTQSVLKNETQHRLDITEIFVALLEARRWPRLTRRARLKRDKKRVESTGLFDADHYLEVNKYFTDTKMDPLEHFIRRGLRKGHAPRPINVPELLAEPLEKKLSKPSVSSHDSKRVNSTTPTLNWVMNTDNVGWANGRNAHLMAEQLPEFQHIFNGRDVVSDVALFFDIRIFQQRGTMAKRNVLRVGGPRAIQIASDGDMNKFKADISNFDAIIVLNKALYNTIAPLHSSVYLIPNALNLDTWRPLDNRRKDRPFMVGIARTSGAKSKKEIKDYAFVEQACEKLTLPILKFCIGDSEISHEDKRKEFYGAIDVLVYPNAPEMECYSDLVMEALASGIPVIATRDEGIQAENIGDGDGVLYCRCAVEDIISSIERLTADAELRGSMRLRALDFAGQNFDIRVTARSYRQVLLPDTENYKARNMSFIPFWEPVEAFASARLRCAHPVELLAGSSEIKARLGSPTSDADIILISQLASDKTMQTLHANPDALVVYDICDRYFEDERRIGGVHARRRFFDLAERADVIVTCTVSLKRAVSELGLKKPIVQIPDGIDYSQYRNSEPSDRSGPIVWFGNPGRGNFESSRWMLDHAMDQMHRRVRIISRKQKFRDFVKTEGKSFEKYFAAAIDWEYETFVHELRNCAVCVISHSEQERMKSANRLITSVTNGVPALVSSSPSCKFLLDAGGCGWAFVENEKELETAIERLEDPLERLAYLERMQDVIEVEYGSNTIKNRYEHLVRNFLPKK